MFHITTTPGHHQSSRGLFVFVWLMVTLTRSANAANPFTSNVVALTPQNWKEEVLDSPHGVFVNICRVGWGYCQLLQPEWEKLAGAVKGQVKIAYWDTEQRGSPPRLLGDFQGTPTIRLFKPKKQQKTKGSHAQKQVMDYNQERKAKDMRTFLEYSMPSYVERISFPEDMTKAVAKADKFGLPKAILFPSKPKTSSVVKYLSAEFRRRLLLIEVVPTKKNESIMKEYGLTTDQLPALVIVKEGTGERVVYEGKDFSRRKLERFLSEHATKEPVYSPVDASEDAAASGEEKKEKEKPVHTEF